MVRNKPDGKGPLPSRQEAFWRALEHSVVSIESVGHRISVNGKSYRISIVKNITTTQGSLYLYVKNNSSNLFAQTALSIKVYDGNANYYIYDEPDVDTSTFNVFNFSNIRSDVTQDPNINAYVGFGNNVTINDIGQLFDEEFIRSGNKEEKSNGNVEYIIGDESSALLQIENASNNEIEVSVSANFYKLPDMPGLIDE